MARCSVPTSLRGSREAVGGYCAVVTRDWAESAKPVGDSGRGGDDAMLLPSECSWKAKLSGG